MTSSLGDRRRRKTNENWLGRYLVVEDRHAKEIRTVLLATAEDTFRILEKMPDTGTMGQQARKVQYRNALREIKDTLHKSFGVQGDIIRNGRKNAAVAAVIANQKEDLKFLTRLAPSKEARDAWMAQQRTMAARNIEAVAARVLESKRPLSKNVWSAEAISKGYIDRIVNTSLARGDSAADIAKRVRGLVHPDVPGGVSYASMRLARTEINNAFHAQAIMDIRESPWVEYAEWHFSKTREPQGCMCEVYEQMQYFPKDQIPSKPHPQCRCYVTGAKISDEEFEDRRKAGQYRLLEDQIEAMEPAPKEGPTTKARQPEGWTGPLVSKDAQNKAVAGQTNYRWMFEVEDDAKRLQAAREGSRVVQVKGYRGGLPTSGKQALLTQEYTDEKLAEHIGKELTARLAYSEPSSRSVYRVVYLDDSQIAKLAEKPVVSLPLSGFQGYMDELDIPAGGKALKPVVLEVKPGAKVASVGDEQVTMGTFQIDKLDEVDGTPVVRMQQTDIREFDAEPISGRQIPDIELVYGNLGPPKKPSGVKPAKKAMPKKKTPAQRKATAAKLKATPKPKHDAAKVAKRIDNALDRKEVRQILIEEFEDVDFIGFSYAPDLETAKGAADAVNDMMDRFPIDIVKVVEFDDISARFGPGYENAFAVCSVYQVPTPNIISKNGIYGKRWHGRVVINTKGAMDDVGWSYKSSIQSGFHPPWELSSNLSHREATRAIVTHELGHALDNRLMYSLRDSVNRVVAEAYEEHKATASRILTKTEFMKRHRPSSYAMEPVGGNKVLSAYHDSIKPNPAEFVAEAIADVVGNGYSNASVLSQALWDEAMELAKKPKVFLPGKGKILDPEFTGR